MNEIKRIKDKLLNNNIKVRRKEKELVISKQYESIMQGANIPLMWW